MQGERRERRRHCSERPKYQIIWLLPDGKKANGNDLCCSIVGRSVIIITIFQLFSVPATEIGGEDFRADDGEDRVMKGFVWGDKPSCTAFLRAQTA